jgi:hypothetical protein
MRRGNTKMRGEKYNENKGGRKETIK